MPQRSDIPADSTGHDASGADELRLSPEAPRSSTSPPQAATNQPQQLRPTSPPPADAPPTKRRRREQAGESASSPLSMLLYPLRGQGFVVLAVYGLMLWGAPGILFLPVAAMVGLLFMEAAKFALDGIPGGPRMPDISLANLSIGMYAVVAVLISQLPRLIGQMLFSGEEGAPETAMFVDTALMALGMYYLPMALLALAELENGHALNPLLVFRSIGRMARTYLLQVSIAAGVYIAVGGLLLISGISVGLFQLISTFLMLYIMLVLMHAVGLAFRRSDIRLD